jgi:CsoR family transcriptional regulator, copper-sensing transcriptional repressor
MATLTSSSPKDEILLSLKKAQSHIDKIIRMVESDEYCIDIIQQLNAVDGYIDSARNKKLSEHLQTCFAEGMSSSDQVRKEGLTDELLRVLKMSK